MKKKVVIEDICELVTNGVTTQVGVAVWVGIRIECNTIQCNYPLPIHKHFYFLTLISFTLFIFLTFIQGLKLKVAFFDSQYQPLIVIALGAIPYVVHLISIHVGRGVPDKLEVVYLL